jgi:hypothetical protein
VRYAAKRDANEGPLVTLARRLGAHWMQIGPLDGWVWVERFDRWVPVEVKNPEGKNKYTPAQKRFLADCAAMNAPVWTWRTESDVLRDLGGKVAA